MMDLDGLAFEKDSVEVERFPWSRVLDLRIRSPYAGKAQWRVAALFNLVSPVYGEHSSRCIEFSFRSGPREVDWELATHDRYSWKLDFVLEDLLELLARERSLEALGRPGVLDAVAKGVVPHVPAKARWLKYVDFFGADKWLGGHGAYDAQLRRAVQLG